MIRCQVSAACCGSTNRYSTGGHKAPRLQLHAEILTYWFDDGELNSHQFEERIRLWFEVGPEIDAEISRRSCPPDRIAISSGNSAGFRIAIGPWDENAR